MINGRSPRKVISTKRKILFTLLVWLALFACYELQTRLTSRPVVGYDPKLGWFKKQRALTTVNACGVDVVKVASDTIFVKQPRQPTGKRVLFIGDSYTYAKHVSSGKAYYDAFETNVNDPFVVYAAGVAGYGSVQEVELLRRAYPLATPEVLFWQLTGNDVRNNVHEFSRRALLSASAVPRPYLDLETNEVRLISSYGWLAQRSEGLRRFHRWARKTGPGEMLFRQWDQKAGFSGLRLEQLTARGLEVLERSLQTAQREFPGLRIVGFSVDDRFEQEFRRVFETNGAMYLRDFAEKVNQSGSTNCAPKDYHWNHRGHRRAGELLAKFVNDGGID